MRKIPPREDQKEQSNRTSTTRIRAVTSTSYCQKIMNGYGAFDKLAFEFNP